MATNGILVSEKTPILVPMSNTTNGGAVTKTPEPQHEVKKSCNDIVFAVIFLLSFGLVVGLFAAYGDDVLTYTGDSLVQEHAKYKYALRICAAIAGGAALLSIVWTGIMLVCGSILIWIAAGVTIVGSLAAGILASKFLKEKGDDSFYWAPAALGALIAVLVTIYICCIRKRIEFASANLRVACKAVMQYPVVLITAFVFTLLQIVWGLVWMVATYAAVNHGQYLQKDSKDYTNAKKFGILVGMILIFFWVLFVLRNIVMVTVSGTVTSWWHRANKDRVPLTSMTALCRAMTYSFGSICFGSLIVSIIETIRTVLSFFRSAASKSGNSVAVCILGCLECIIAFISKMVQYFNKYAYTYVGIYGYSFVTSGKKVFELFEGKGWSAIANDSLIDNVLLMGSVFVGLTGAAAGWGVAAKGDPQWTVNVSNPHVTLGIAGFLVGFSVCYIIMGVINGAVATCFVLFAEDAHHLKTTHANEHEALESSWKKIYPQEYAMGIQKELPAQSV